MRVTERKITVRELLDGFHDDGEGGVRGYGGVLDIRPPYQREFIYDDAKQRAVIDSIQNDMPLSIMYWAVKVSDDGGQSYEVLDGQQRTLSICRYVEGAFADDQTRYFYNLPSDAQQQILDYQLHVYVCDGNASEKLAWFRRINIAGVPLKDQELRNAVYAGPWLADAKAFFSRPGAGADLVDGDYVKGDAKRQDILEKALSWIGHREGCSIEQYMATHQLDPNANELRQYYRAIFSWVGDTFIVHRKEMVGQPWGEFFNSHCHRSDLDGKELEARIADLMADEEVTNKKGIYAYVLTGDAKHLSLREFSPAQKREMYERQGGRCARPHYCGHDPEQVFELGQMEADHVDPWHSGGRTEVTNGQMLCRSCNRRKGGQ